MSEFVTTPMCVKLNGGATNTNNDSDEGRKALTGELTGRSDRSRVPKFNEALGEIAARLKRFKLQPIFYYLAEVLKEKKLTPEDVSDILFRVKEYAASHGLEIVERRRRPPQTWQEAKDQAASFGLKLKSWHEAKLEDSELTIIDYLRDPVIGLGKWVLEKPGLPRHLLKLLYVPVNEDKPLSGSPYVALANWLKGKNADGTGHNIPPGMYLPTKVEETDRLYEEAPTPGDRPARADWAKRARKNYNLSPDRS